MEAPDASGVMLMKGKVRFTMKLGDRYHHDFSLAMNEKGLPYQLIMGRDFMRRNDIIYINPLYTEGNRVPTH